MNQTGSSNGWRPDHAALAGGTRPRGHGAYNLSCCRRARAARGRCTSVTNRVRAAQPDRASRVNACAACGRGSREIEFSVAQQARVCLDCYVAAPVEPVAGVKPCSTCGEPPGGRYATAGCCWPCWGNATPSRRGRARRRGAPSGRSSARRSSPRSTASTPAGSRTSTTRGSCTSARSVEAALPEYVAVTFHGQAARAELRCSLGCTEEEIAPALGMRGGRVTCSAPRTSACRPDAGDETSQASPVDGEPQWPEPMRPEAYHGPLGELVRKIGPQTEADPHALLLSVLAGFGNAIGRGPGLRIEGSLHATNYVRGHRR